MLFAILQVKKLKTLSNTRKYESNKYNIAGMKFGYLYVTDTFISNNSQRYWLCKCKCGNEKYIPTRNLICGKTVSCGCYAIEKRKNRKGENNPNFKHGKSHKRLYTIYNCMKQRCYNEKANEYYLYGGKGIKICDEWMNDFESFYKWSMENGYADNLTIDRINNDGNYEPDNCQWISRSDNSKKVFLNQKESH